MSGVLIQPYHSARTPPESDMPTWASEGTAVLTLERNRENAIDTSDKIVHGIRQLREPHGERAALALVKTSTMSLGELYDGASSSPPKIQLIFGRVLAEIPDRFHENQVQNCV